MHQESSYRTKNIPSQPVKSTKKEATYLYNALVHHWYHHNHPFHHNTCLMVNTGYYRDMKILIFYKRILL